jgi:DNA-binding MarR family transcriptional regulator
MTLTDYECLRIAHIFFILTRAYDTNLGIDIHNTATGFTHQDFAGLFAIGQRAPITARQLSNLLGISPGTTSIYVQKLVEKGFITKEQDRTDRRNWWLRLSSEGMNIYQSILATTVQFSRDLSSALDDDEQILFYKLLKKAYEGIIEKTPHIVKKESYFGRD